MKERMVFVMKFELIDDLIIITLDGRKYLVDTGAPLSFSLSNEAISLKIGEVEAVLEPHIASCFVIDAMNHLLPGIKISGIIGNDLISQTNLTVDYLNRNIYFSLEDCVYGVGLNQFNFEYKNGYIHLDMYHNDNKLDMIVDTGSKNWFVKSDYLNLSNPVGEYIDYSAELGKMEGSYYELIDSIHNEIVNAGILDKGYAPYLDGIIPLVEFVRLGYCQFDFKKGIMTINKRFL